MQTEALKYAYTIAQSLAREYQHDTYSAAHLLMGLLHNDVGLASLLVKQGRDISYLREWAEVRLEESPKALRVSETPVPDRVVEAVRELADLIALQFNRDTDPLATMAAMLKPGVGFSSEQLRSFSLTQKEILGLIVNENQSEEGQNMEAPVTESGKARSGNISFLEKYTLDKTKKGGGGKVGRIIGRDREIRQIAEIVGRRSKPNVMIVGEPGVGKSALVDGFAQLIYEKRVPFYLQTARLLELDTGSLVAGASYKGEIEERLKGIITEIKAYDKVILFIDEVHILLDPKGSIGGGVAQLLKPELARGELTIIGATTQEEYRKYIERDEAFNRRFEVLVVEEPDETTATRMVESVLPVYEEFHGIKVADGTVAEAVKLSRRYMKERRLPDVALDLLDRTMASMRLLSEVSVNELDTLLTELNGLSAIDEAERMHELVWFSRELSNRVSPLLLGQLNDGAGFGVEVTHSQLLTRLTSLRGLALQLPDSVGKHDVAAVIAYKTGIPLGKLQSSERDKLLGIEEVLKKRVVGQDHAVAALSEAIRESRSGLIKAGQPIGSFFLLGPTGTGKTEIAKALADFLFSDESFLIRFDMSEFKEEHSAALLYGAPPGYVGYEEGGLLVNKIRQKPYSVVLFDEIEKAHPSVFDLFLQILDEGKLHDRLGKEGDFSNAVILFTSNIGQEHVVKEFGRGYVPESADIMEIMAHHFRPEFLARLTEIVPFAPISEENVVRIFDIHLRTLTDLLDKQGITLNLTPEVKKYIAMEGFSPRYGVRPLKGTIRNLLRRPISRMIISGEVHPDSVIELSRDISGAIKWDVQGKTELAGKM